MKFIKLFENFQESEFETILYGSDAKLTLEVGSGYPIDDIDLIEDISKGDIRYWDPLLSSDEGLCRKYRDYFSYFTDYDWKLDITTSQFYIQIELRKSFKDNIDDESLFNEINKNCENINRAIELDGFQSLYQIKFNKTVQSDNNPITHKNDLFRYKGFEKITEPRYTGDKMVGRIPVYIKFTII